MILVQLAAGDRGEDASAQAVWLGLDVAWDIYIGVGTLLFAAAAYTHEWFGRIIGIFGIVIAVLLLFLNLWTFPAPPANAGLFDVGPLVGGWYLVRDYCRGAGPEAARCVTTSRAAGRQRH